jgi:SAM-dependent methyltransferase
VHLPTGSAHAFFKEHPDPMTSRFGGRNMLRALIDPLGRVGLLPFAFRIYERLAARAGFSKRAEQEKNGLAIPPAHLLYQVAGSIDEAWFLECGDAMFQAIGSLLRAQGIALENLRAVLDFGCGCGRVLRHWSTIDGPAISGSDYNPAMITWCQSNLRFAQTSGNEYAPPLEKPDGAYDFIYAVSVFTHLAEDLQAAWMRELARLLSPGGHLLVTTHGRNYLHALNTTERAAFEAGDLVTRHERASGTNLCSAYHPESYVRGEWTCEFVVCEFAPAGTRDGIFQDLYLLRKI